MLMLVESSEAHNRQWFVIDIILSANKPAIEPPLPRQILPGKSPAAFVGVRRIANCCPGSPRRRSKATYDEPFVNHRPESLPSRQ